MSFMYRKYYIIINCYYYIIPFNSKPTINILVSPQPINSLKYTDIVSHDASVVLTQLVGFNLFLSYIEYRNINSFFDTFKIITYTRDVHSKIIDFF